MKINKAIFQKQGGERRIMQFIYLDELPPGFLYANYYLPRMAKKRILESRKGLAVDIMSQEQAEEELRQDTRKLQNGMRRVWDLEANDFRIFNEKAIVGPKQSYEVENVKEMLETIKAKLIENV